MVAEETVTTLKSVSNFNFSIGEAMSLLQEHSMKDNLFDPATEWALVATYATVMATGLISNILMAAVICSRKSTIRTRGGATRQGGSHFFLLNLNASDLALCVIAMPFTLLQLVRRHWPLGDALCKGVALIQGASVFVSAFTISAIAIQRQRAIVRLGSSHRHHPPFSSLNCCVDSSNNGGRYPVSFALAIWVLSLVLAAPASIARTLAYAEVAGVHVYTRCVERWPSTFTQNSYAFATVILQLVTPTALLASTHIRVKGQLRYALTPPTVENLSSQCYSQSMVCTERLRRELNRNRRATVILLHVTAAFALTWLPWNAVNLVIDIAPTLMPPQKLYLTFAVCHLIAMCSATLNPLLYGWLNTNLRRQVCSLKKHFTRSAVEVKVEEEELHQCQVLEQVKGVEMSAL